MVYKIVSNDYNLSDIKFPTSKNKNIVNKQSKFEKHINKKMPLPKFKQMIFTIKIISKRLYICNQITTKQKQIY